MMPLEERRADLDRRWAAHHRAVRHHGYLGMFIAVAWMGSFVVLMFASIFTKREPDPPKESAVYVSSADPAKRYHIIDGVKVYLSESGDASEQ